MTPKEESVEKIMQAYLKTHMTEKQFEAMVLQALTDAESRAGVSMGDYDKGFSAGYDEGYAAAEADTRNP
jgi:flagellar biosynthesis/type III secretory pathway protein FliH